MTKKQYGTVLITGAAQRIGREIAYGLASEGRAVAIHYKSSSVEALKIESDIKQAGGNAYAIQCDLADETAVSSLIAEINKSAVKKSGGSGIPQVALTPDILWFGTLLYCGLDPAQPLVKASLKLIDAEWDKLKLNARRDS